MVPLIVMRNRGSMASRRDFIRLVMMGSGAVYALGLGGCKRPNQLQLLRHPRRVTDTPKFVTAHKFLRDRSTPPAPSRTYQTDILVIGAGVAGLTTAARLEQEGFQVTIVESEHRVGGTAASAELAGGMVPLGSVYFVERTDDLDLLLKLGHVEPVVCPEDGYDFGHGNVVHDLWSDHTLDTVIRDETERDGMKRFRDHILGMGDGLPTYPLPEVLSPEHAKLDIVAEDWVRSFKSQTLHTVLDAYSRSSMGALLSRTNLYCLLNFYSGEFGQSFDLPRYTIAGGTGFIASSVLPKLADVQRDMVAVRVRENGRGAEADCVDEHGSVVRFSAKRIVMAGHKYQVPYMVEGLPAEQADACRALAYAPYITLHVISDLPLVEPHTYDTWNLTSEFETDVVNPVSVPNTSFKQNVASLYIPMDEFARGQLQDPELFARKVADISDRFISTRSEEEQDSVREIYAWGWGHGLVIPTPGSHSGIAQRASRRFGNVLFANADCDASPAIENAAYQGGRAALEILSDLKG